MKIKALVLILAMGALALQSCKKDEPIIANATETTFQSLFNDAKFVSWTTNANGYSVADFQLNGTPTTAWFDEFGTWYMTETDVPYADLPQAVKDAFNSSEYANWTIDDIDKLERYQAETLYVIEVEQGENESDLYYSEDGILVKVVVDDDGGYDDEIPTQTPDDIETQIATMYPDARIIEIEMEHGKYEVEIIHDGRGKEVQFSTDFQWIQTSYDVYISEIPELVMTTLQNSEYASYQIDDVDFVETLQVNYYVFELEKGESERTIKIDISGNIL